MDKRSSFTLIEIVVVVGIFLSLAMLLIPFSIQQLNQNRAESSTKIIYSKLFFLQQNAYTQLDNLSYGMELGSNTVTLFNGYSTDNYLSSEILSLEAGVTIKSKNLNNGSNKIFFPKGSVRPNTYGSLTIGDSSNTYRLDINSEGLINYYRE